MNLKKLSKLSDSVLMDFVPSHIFGAFLIKVKEQYGVTADDIYKNCAQIIEKYIPGEYFKWSAWDGYNLKFLIDSKKFVSGPLGSQSLEELESRITKELENYLQGTGVVLGVTVALPSHEEARSYISVEFDPQKVDEMYIDEDLDDETSGEARDVNMGDVDKLAEELDVQDLEIDGDILSVKGLGYAEEDYEYAANQEEIDSLLPEDVNHTPPHEDTFGYIVDLTIFGDIYPVSDWIKSACKDAGISISEILEVSNPDIGEIDFKARILR